MVTREEVGGDNGGRERRVFRNNYKGHMDKAKVGVGCGDGWGGGERLQVNADNCT